MSDDGKRPSRLGGVGWRAFGALLGAGGVVLLGQLYSSIGGT